MFKSFKPSEISGIVLNDWNGWNNLNDDFYAFLKIRGVRMRFRIVVWMERSGIQEGGVGRGRGNGARE